MATAITLNDLGCPHPASWLEAIRCWGTWSILQPQILAALITTIFGGLMIWILSSVWSRSQKRKELDLATLEEFQKLYGEFFALYHLWDDFKRSRFDGIVEPNSFVKGVIKRAYSMEGNMEAVLTRIAAEKKLSPEEIDSLGKFRQGFQCVREYVSKDAQFNWSYDFHPEYASLKIHASSVSDIILFSKARSGTTKSLQILDITSNRYETPQCCSWLLTDKELERFKSPQQLNYERSLK